MNEKINYEHKISLEENEFLDFIQLIEKLVKEQKNEKVSIILKNEMIFTGIIEDWSYINNIETDLQDDAIIILLIINNFDKELTNSKRFNDETKQWEITRQKYQEYYRVLIKVSEIVSMQTKTYEKRIGNPYFVDENGVFIK